ncbi:MAG: MoaD/ThiS family protein [Candidatus Aenigmatarchaeota archaeon]
MEVKIKFREEESEIEIEEGSIIEDVLERVGINKETVIVKRNGKIIPPEEDVNDKDYLECIRIISGG